jgi:hypothetical protein
MTIERPMFPPRAGKPALRLVGGIDSTPHDALASCQTSFRKIDDRPTAGSSSTTADNGRLRQIRKEIWRMAEAATRYWRVRIDFDHAISFAQRMEIPEAAYHPVVDSKDLRLVDRYREALVKQLLTPAPDTAAVKWKQDALARGQYRYVGVKPERIERAIAEDLAFLAAHPIRRNNSEVMARRREFKEAMRRRIRDVAASRDLSDEEIEPALTLKHQGSHASASGTASISNGCWRARGASSRKTMGARHEQQA